MATMSNLVLYRYSPENMPEDVLRKLFVGRGKLFKSLFKEIENAARKKTPRFYLIVGPRGIGKSHFLVLLYHEIENKLGSLLIPIKLREEEYSVYRASDLFLRILEERKEETKDILSLAQEDEILLAAVERLKQISRRDGKRYIIFIENLHELFKQLDTEELQKLRSIFQKYDIFSVIASAPMIFQGIADHDEPFYNFFEIQHLKEFSVIEIKELIQKIAEAENNQEFLKEFDKYEPKVHGLAHLTGGSPRLVILFYEMITRGELEDIEKAFFKIIDEHTPYYQEIFQLLTGQKRRIFDIVISSASPITPKQISEEARIDFPTVTTQLRRLEKDGYVISRPMGKYTNYEVRERLFRLWREMRQPLGRKRVSALLEFLQYWYTPEELKELFRAKFEMLEAGKKAVLRDLCYYTDVLPPKFKAEALLKLTPKLIELGEWEETAHEIQQLKEMATQTEDRELEGKLTLYEILSEGRKLLTEKRYEEALETFNKALEINPKDEFALSRKGYILGNLGRYEEALEAFNKVLDINPKNAFALSRKGVALGSLGMYEDALEVFNKALEIKPKDEFSLSLKGAALGGIGRYKDAVETFNSVIEINPKNSFVLSRKGLALIGLGNYVDAIEAFDKAIEINPHDTLSLLEKGHIVGCLQSKYEEALNIFDNILKISPKNEDALSHKGITLANLERYEEALEVFNKVLEINSKNEFALSRKGSMLGNLGRHEEALNASNEALEINPKDEFAITNKGFALVYLGRYDEALDTFNKALEINPNYEFALSRRGLALEFLGRYQEALNAFDKALEINPEDTFSLFRKGHVLGCLLHKNEEALNIFDSILKISPQHEEALMHKGITLANLDRHEEALEALNKVLEINPKDEYALLNIGEVLIELKKYSEALDIAQKVKDATTNLPAKISATLILIKVYIVLDRKTDAILEFENIKDRIVDQALYLIENFAEVCFILALSEMKTENRGNAARFIEMAYSTSSKLKEDDVKSLTITFLKGAADSGLPVIKMAVEEIIKLQGNEYRERIKPVIKALEIIETKDIPRYYDLQVEEREIVADIVRKITKSDELLPAEIKMKESHLTDYVEPA